MKINIRVYIIFCLAALLLLVSGTAVAQEIYYNGNIDACSFTDRAGFELQGPTRLTAIELWYRWGRNESAVDYTLFHNGAPVKHGRLARGGCDPYQEAWCQARANIGVELPPGYIEVRTVRGKVCQNAGSSGQGFIRAFGISR